jgi:hypothetical protein
MGARGQPLVRRISPERPVRMALADARLGVRAVVVVSAFW